jgi:hypothetical protein
MINKKTAIYLFVFYFFIPSTGYSRGIDSLLTKEEVYHFLEANLSEARVICPTQCFPISPVLKKELDSLHQYVNSDSAITKRLTKLSKSTTHRFNIDSINLPSHYSASYPFRIVDSLLKSEPWDFYKFDIDGNGHVDLVVDGAVLIVVMDVNGRMEAHILSFNHFYGFKGLVAMPDGNNLLVLRHDHDSPKEVTMQYIDSQRESKYASYDTVVYKYNVFASYKSPFCPAKVAKIRYYFCKLEGFGVDNDYRAGLEINRNGNCFLQYNEYNVTFYSKVDSLKLQKLWNFLSSIDFKSKCDKYWIEQDHGEGCSFAVYFEDGTVKIIDFWICSPKHELGYLSLLFSYMSDALTWQLYEKRSYFERSLLPLHHQPNYNKLSNVVNCNCY